jgi:hypothetical protein
VERKKQGRGHTWTVEMADGTLQTLRESQLKALTGYANLIAAFDGDNVRADSSQIQSQSQSHSEDSASLDLQSPAPKQRG